VLVVDTGVLLASADAGDPDHRACCELLGRERRPFITTALVVAETCHLIDRQLGPVAEAAFIRSIAAGDLTAEPLGRDDWDRIADLIEQYADLPLGATDASLVVLVERHRVERIATLDHRHFSVVRPHGRGALELLPS
jgi:predicted nucleic acid-binding protein